MTTVYKKGLFCALISLLINAKILDFTDFSTDIWYNICKGFNKMESFSLQIFEEFHE